MSLSWLDRLSLFVHPAEAVLLCRGWRGKAERLARPVGAVPEDGPVWQAALEAALALLDERAGAGASLQIVIANPYVRYVLLPWSEAVIGDKARRALALALLRSSLGEQAGQLDIALDQPVFGKNGVAAAIDQGLLDALRQGAKRRRLRLGAVQPQLGADLAAVRRQSSDGCLLFEDGDWQTLVGLQAGNVCLLRNHRAAATAEQRQRELQGLLAMQGRTVNRKNLQIFTNGSWPEALDEWTLECRRPSAEYVGHA